MTGIKPEQRKDDAGLANETGISNKPGSQRGEHGIVLDEQGQEQPKDRKRAQDNDQQSTKQRR